MDKKYNRKKELLIKILILITLILLIIVTSFRTGQKFYLLKNTNFDDTVAEINSEVARWNFNVRIFYGNEVKNVNEKN